MPKHVSATDAKINLGSMMDWTVEQSDEVIIETRGKAKAVLVSYPVYQQMQKLQEIFRREKALLELESLAVKVQGREEKLSSPEAEETANRYLRDIFREMIAEEKIAYQADED